MPSPLGHGMAALAMGWAVAGKPIEKSALFRQVAILTAIGVAPDLDLLIYRHSMETHSIGAAVIVASLAAWQRWPVAGSRTMIWIAVALAWLSHPLIDAFGSDTSVPVGIMAFWPFSREHVQTPLHLFAAISRRYWRNDFWSLNLPAILREVVVLAPVLGVVALFARKQPTGSSSMSHTAPGP